MSTAVRPNMPIRRTPLKKATARVKKSFKFELTSEDIALDNAISAAAARDLAARPA
jgi:hypothetical protein